VHDERTYDAGAIAIDILERKIYWWLTIQDSEFNMYDVLARADLDGKNWEVLREAESIMLQRVSIALAPWEKALYTDGIQRGFIHRIDLDSLSVHEVGEANSISLAVAACTRQESTSLDDLPLIAECLGGPADKLIPDCECADLTGEGLTDLRDVSAFMLSAR
jgi:hypothetical protein